MSAETYVKLFALGGVGGWLFESVQGSEPSDRVLGLIGLEQIPFLTVYGAGLVFIYAVSEWLPEASLLLLALLCALLLTALECCAGKMSEWLFGSPSWHYTTGIPFCSGYGSVAVTGVWFAAALIILSVIRMRQPRKDR